MDNIQNAGFRSKAARICFAKYSYNGLGINSGTKFKLILPRDKIIV
jgi:hypothetical protein